MWLPCDAFIRRYNAKHPLRKKSLRTVQTWCKSVFAPKDLAIKMGKEWMVRDCEETMNYLSPSDIVADVIQLLASFRTLYSHKSYRQVACDLGIPETYISEIRNGDDTRCRTVLRALYEAWPTGREGVNRVFAKIGLGPEGADAVDGGQGVVEL